MTWRLEVEAPDGRTHRALAERYGVTKGAVSSILNERTWTHMNERDWQQQLLDLAALLGWTWYHVIDQRQYARRTHSGFPDLVMWRDRILYVELKGDRTPVTTAQRDTVAALQQAGGECYIWRPSDFDQAREVLTRRLAPLGSGPPRVALELRERDGGQ